MSIQPLDLSKEPRAVASMDKTLGHGADCAILVRENPDPWGTECLQRMVDTLVNHDRCLFPLPTKSATTNAENIDMPTTLSAAEKVGLVQRILMKTAEDVPIEAGLESKQTDVFRSEIKERAGKIREFSQFHRIHLREEHDKNVPRSVLERTRCYSAEHASEFLEFEKDLRLSNEEVLYLFDVGVRVVPYSQIAAEHNAWHHSHPFRDKFGRPAGSQTNVYEGSPWGSMVLWMLEKGIIQKDAKAVMDWAAIIRESVFKNSAWVASLVTKTETEKKDALRQAAADARLPAVLKSAVADCMAIAIGAVIALSGEETRQRLVPLVVTTGILKINEVIAPGSVARCMRGMFRYPIIDDEPAKKPR